MRSSINWGLSWTSLHVNIAGNLWRRKVTTVTFTQIQNYLQITYNRVQSSSVYIFTAQWIERSRNHRSVPWRVKKLCPKTPRPAVGPMLPPVVPFPRVKRAGHETGSVKWSPSYACIVCREISLSFNVELLYDAICRQNKESRNVVENKLLISSPVVAIRSSVDKKNQLYVTFCILYFSSNSCSTCFGQPCVHHQELTTAWCYSLVLVWAVAAGRWSSPVGR